MPNPNNSISGNNNANNIANLGNASKVTKVVANVGVVSSPSCEDINALYKNDGNLDNTPGATKDISYTDTKVIGNGSFGVVFQARLIDTGELVAIKKVLQDKRFKNRELQIMKELNHCNIVRLKYYFYCTGEKKDDIFLNLVLEYVPETVYRIARHYTKSKLALPIIFVKLYLYQLFRALAYIHYKGICHRDIKPQNLLLDPETSVLKLCDFGSAKELIIGQPNVSYICSRYYRAPELIFGATDYSYTIDIWSAGCVLAELLLGHPLFPGDSGVDQLVEIIKILGTPSREQIRQMNPNYVEFKFPHIKPHPWTKVFKTRVPPEAIDLISKLLEYIPSQRLSPLEACAHAFFDELRAPTTTLPNGAPLPPLFNFTPLELTMEPHLNLILIPAAYQAVLHTSTSVTGGNNPHPNNTGGAPNSPAHSKSTPAPHQHNTPAGASKIALNHTGTNTNGNNNNSTTVNQAHNATNNDLDLSKTKAGEAIIESKTVKGVGTSPRTKHPGTSKEPVPRSPSSKPLGATAVDTNNLNTKSTPSKQQLNNTNAISVTNKSSNSSAQLSSTFSDVPLPSVPINSLISANEQAK